MFCHVLQNTLPKGSIRPGVWQDPENQRGEFAEVKNQAGPWTPFGKKTECWTCIHDLEAMRMSLNAGNSNIWIKNEGK